MTRIRADRCLRKGKSRKLWRAPCVVELENSDEREAMARGDVTEYGDQLWAKNRGRIEFYDEAAEGWFRWDPGKHDTMAPPGFFEKTELRLLERFTSTRTIRLAFKMLLVTAGLFVPLLVAYTVAFAFEIGSQKLFAWLAVGYGASFALFQIALGAVLATVALALAGFLGNRPLFEEDPRDEPG